jgi:hypothetical protein
MFQALLAIFRSLYTNGTCYIAYLLCQLVAPGLIKFHFTLYHVGFTVLIWSGLFGSETWTLWTADRKYLKGFET